MIVHQSFTASVVKCKYVSRLLGTPSWCFYSFCLRNWKCSFSLCVYIRQHRGWKMYDGIGPLGWVSNLQYFLGDVGGWYLCAVIFLHWLFGVDLWTFSQRQKSWLLFYESIKILLANKIGPLKKWMSVCFKVSSLVHAGSLLLTMTFLLYCVVVWQLSSTLLLRILDYHLKRIFEIVSNGTGYPLRGPCDTCRQRREWNVEKFQLSPQIN